MATPQVRAGSGQSSQYGAIRTKEQGQDTDRILPLFFVSVSPLASSIAVGSVLTA